MMNLVSAYRNKLVHINFYYYLGCFIFPHKWDLLMLIFISTDLFVATTSVSMIHNAKASEFTYSGLWCRLCLKQSV